MSGHEEGSMGSEIFDQEIVPDKTYAQILIELTPPDKTFEEAKKIIEGLGVHIVETHHAGCQRYAKRGL
jgi:hypothetical protein